MQALVEIYNDDVEVGSILKKYLPSTYSVRLTDLTAEAATATRERLMTVSSSNISVKKGRSSLCLCSVFSEKN